jgi:hypothetical protein
MLNVTLLCWIYISNFFQITLDQTCIIITVISITPGQSSRYGIRASWQSLLKPFLLKMSYV